MTTHDQPSKEHLLQPPNESERNLLEKAGIPLDQSSPRLRYVKALKRKIQQVLKGKRLRRGFGGMSAVEDEILETWELQSDSLEAKFQWRDAIDLLLELLEEPSPTEGPKTELNTDEAPQPPQAIRDTPNLQLDKRSIIFKGFLKYTGGVFHRADERVLFEYFLMLYHYYNRVHGTREFYRSLDALSQETGVGIHSIRRFISKAMEKGFITYQLKGIPARNHYRVDVVKINASIKDVFKTSPPWSPS